MAIYRLAFFATLFLLLAGCMGQSLQLNIRFDRVDGLKAGDAVVFRDQDVGQVDAVEYTKAGVFVAHIHIEADYRAAATTETRFYLAVDPANPERRRIEVEHPGGGQPLADGATVDGYPGGLLPFGELFRGMGEGLRQFGQQLEQLRRGLEQLPDSEEAKKLEEEWKRFMERLDKAGKNAEKDLEPRLRRQMEDWNKRFRELEPKTPPRPPQPSQPPQPKRQDGYNI